VGKGSSPKENSNRTESLAKYKSNAVLEEVYGRPGGHVATASLSSLIRGEKRLSGFNQKRTEAVADAIKKGIFSFREFGN